MLHLLFGLSCSEPEQYGTLLDQVGLVGTHAVPYPASLSNSPIGAGWPHRKFREFASRSVRRLSPCLRSASFAAPRPLSFAQMPAQHCCGGNRLIQLQIFIPRYGPCVPLFIAMFNQSRGFCAIVAACPFPPKARPRFRVLMFAGVA